MTFMALRTSLGKASFVSAYLPNNGEPNMKNMMNVMAAGMI